MLPVLGTTPAIFGQTMVRLVIGRVRTGRYGGVEGVELATFVFRQLAADSRLGGSLGKVFVPPRDVGSNQLAARP